MESTSLPTQYTNNSADIPALLQNRPEWLTTLLDQYDLTDWCFYGYVGSGADLLGIGVLFQKKEGQYTAVLGVYEPGTNGVWNLSASMLPLIVDAATDTSPWSVAGIEFISIDGNGANPGLELGSCTITLLTGSFGEVGATYQIKGKVFGANELDLDIQMTDNIGAFNIGYGPASFLPNYLLQDQANTLNSAYNGDLEQYLNSENPPLLDQGSYYFSMAIEVTSFNISRILPGSTQPTVQSGTSGYIWFDNVTQNFGQLNDLPKGASVSWFWLAVPQIQEGVALAATQLIYTDDSPLNLQNVNSAAIYSSSNVIGQRWNSNKITFTAQPAVNGQVREFTLVMEGDDTVPDVSLTISAWSGDQNIFGSTEGNYLVTGTYGSITITAHDEVYAWCEIRTNTNAQTLTRLAGFSAAADTLKTQTSN